TLYILLFASLRRIHIHNHPEITITRPAFYIIHKVIHARTEMISFFPVAMQLYKYIQYKIMVDITYQWLHRYTNAIPKASLKKMIQLIRHFCILCFVLVPKRHFNQSEIRRKSEDPTLFQLMPVKASVITGQ